MSESPTAARVYPTSDYPSYQRLECSSKTRGDLCATADDNDLYSIVMPIYNREEIDGQTILRKWTTIVGSGLRIELVLVNDGNNDHSWKVIHGLQGTTPVSSPLICLVTVSNTLRICAAFDTRAGTGA